MIIECTAKTNVSPEAIWQIWEEVDQWNTWDPGVISFSIEGPFASKTQGTMVLKNGSTLYVELIDVHPSERFSLKAHRVGLDILLTYRVEQRGGETYVTHRFEALGFFAPLLNAAIGSEIRDSLPKELEALIARAVVNTSYSI